MQYPDAPKTFYQKASTQTEHYTPKNVKIIYENLIVPST